jgi:hypothetical protein
MVPVVELTVWASAPLTDNRTSNNDKPTERRIVPPA